MTFLPAALLDIPELDKEVDMASDLMKAMFGRDEQAGPEVTPEVTDPVTGKVRPKRPKL